MIELQTEIIINAPAKKVWSILTDFKEFPEWNPFIKSLQGKLEVGNRLHVVLNNGKGTSTFQPNVTVVEPNRAFEWLGSLPLGLFKGNHYFHIQPIGDTQVKFIHGERFTGLLAGILMKQIGEQTRKGFISMNEALKARAEATV